MSLISEFKQFAMRGNVVDLAVGVVIGAAFGKIVSALVSGIIMPVVGVLVGGVNFADLAITLKPGTEGVEPVLLQYGLFVQSTVDFVIIAFAIFIAIKLMNKMQRKQEEAPPKPAEPSAEVTLLTEIRDALKK
ncbi:MAG: large-conductance mechanosensitive channel protein MscL [Xanthomonadaceae bacterium]|nr:large-conductance mechanosensitive channel protein MscL [Xanthomonadaceae bacterium]MDP2184718.1 large-conductance mechanosensitive channel protein MscL [Xanthomonadales bacterium]MDZ4116395.1 large-conductance mechanosensitive channel protein MscL [Xanthomonadaceae bacterium]MDZ4379628.1 large-conductance mechanosensitive channel protein MscL [Xanthomonadaceae bacterium]